MTMMRYCPRCRTEREVDESLCLADVGGETCGWDLTLVPEQPAGWRPAALVPATAAPFASDEARAPNALSCPNGHPVDSGDFLCPECGVELSSTPGPDAVASDVLAPTVVDDWEIVDRLDVTSAAWESFAAIHRTDGRRGVLTLFGAGKEPDPAVYEVLQRLPLDHLPEIMAVGRWHQRAYEVTEQISGGNFVDLDIAPDDRAAIERVVSELGSALASFAEHGLRHRDLRPEAILVRSHEPLDLVVTRFGSARLSDFDLDIVSPLDTNRYTAPEAALGGVAPASDWWSLGIVLLELVTGGRCFEGVNETVFLIHALTNGIPIPSELDSRISLLLRGLLAHDRNVRWSWEHVQRWLAGESPEAPSASGHAGAAAQDTGPTIALGDGLYRRPADFALAAASESGWDEAREKLRLGAIATWAEAAGLEATALAWLRRLGTVEGVSDDFRLSLSLKTLNSNMPLVLRGEIVTPGWLLDHPAEGLGLISGQVPDLLERLELEPWIPALKRRAERVRERARRAEIGLDEEALAVNLLATSRTALTARWDARGAHLVDTDHPALLGILERANRTDEDLILLLSAAIGQFKTPELVIDEAQAISTTAGLGMIDRAAAAERLRRPRREVLAEVEGRVSSFARCGVSRVDEWVDRFRLERRMPLARALVVLGIEAERWQPPPRQTMVATLLKFFGARVASAIQSGPLTRMTIGKSTARVDLNELGTERVTSSALVGHVVSRGEHLVEVDPAAFGRSETLERRVRLLYNHANVYRRDTGIDGLYLGFPFLISLEARANARPKVAPVLLWPVRLKPELGTVGRVALGFDREREEIRLNPALEGVLGVAEANRWREVTDELCRRSDLTIATALDMLGSLAPADGRALVPLPGKDARVRPGERRLQCSAALFHLAYAGHAVIEDLRQLEAIPPAGTALESVLRVAEPPIPTEMPAVPEVDRFFTARTDPSQENAVFEARREPGLVVQGPPGTGKSQTILSIVADAIGRRRSLLVVCQKQAALEVVYKRLKAEGLEDRILLITDVNKDREPTIKSVRQQVETLGIAAALDAASWQHQRPQIAARIESVERELDAYHEALHTVDDVTGLTYREIIGDLVELEDARPAPIAVPALRGIVGTLDLAATERVEAACGPLSRLWLTARYEGSPVADLSPFGDEPGVLEEFERCFFSFCRAEAARERVLSVTPDAAPIGDPGPYRAWLRDNASGFRSLDDAGRRRLRKWLPLFRQNAGTIPAADVVRELELCIRALENLRVSPEPKWRRVMITADDATLAARLAEAEVLAKPVSLFARLSPARWLSARRLRAYFSAQNVGPIEAALAPFIDAAVYERSIRPWRHRTIVAAGQLGVELEKVEELTAFELAEVCHGLREEIRRVGELVGRIDSCPDPQRALAAVRTANATVFDAFLIGVEQGCARREAVLASETELARLSPWVAPAWRAARTHAIAEGLSNEAALAAIGRAKGSWAAYQRFRLRAERLDSTALAVFGALRQSEPALDAISESDLDAVVRRTIRREARLAWKARLEAARPGLLLETEEIRGNVEVLADADRKMRDITRTALARGIDRVRVRDARQWEEITRLRGPRALRLREFLDAGRDRGILELRPVWMMNPDVASRVLPLQAGLFDAVVYDEASQMPVEQAIPTLYRSKTLVVSGDDKQMPPSSFFSSRVDADEPDGYEADELDERLDDAARSELSDAWDRREIKDCPDLLQLARTVLPTATLEIHYRSIYRELISYSNASFYGDRLSVPVRHPEDEIRRACPVEMIRVNGAYEGQTNREEAVAVVDLLERLWCGEEKSDRSVGVVTFNRKQSDVIDEVLEERAEINTAFRAALTRERERLEEGEDMSFFVKNVENVQGDERDVIVFSTTFGRNRQGTFRRNFGVLGQKGGERRLNVAVTRARAKVYLVTSIPIGEVSDLLTTRRSPSSPRDYLQAYLEYARSLSAGEFVGTRTLLGRLVGASQNGNGHVCREPDAFERSVGRFIESLGYLPSTIRDGGPFDVDFAIVHPRTGLYGIGIECDAPRHGLLARARARELWRPKVLTQSIPRIHRVSSRAWYHDRQGERDRLRDAVLDALA